jgi:arylsulfatase A-like enzyme
VAPFAGLFVNPELRDRFYEWERRLAKAAGLRGPIWVGPWEYPPEAFAKTGISRMAFFDVARSLYDEVMAHNDYQLGQMVERLKASGEWEHTLLIVAADHGSGQGLGLFDPLPPRWGPNLRSFRSRVPLIVVWPERIAAGQRFNQPVSMVDMLPTILDLAGLPAPEVLQGQSLAPLLLGKDGWEPRPVILDEFYVDWDTGELSGLIEVVDGRWGASLRIAPSKEEGEEQEAPPERRRPVPLLVYDLWNDPYCLRSLHEDRPDLVEKYTQFLEAQWEAHRALAQRFTKTGETPLTPEQIRTLRSLGYVQ